MSLVLDFTSHQLLHALIFQKVPSEVLQERKAEIYLERKGYVKKELDEEREERIHAQVKAEANGLQVD